MILSLIAYYYAVTLTVSYIVGVAMSGAVIIMLLCRDTFFNSILLCCDTYCFVYSWCCYEWNWEVVIVSSDVLLR